MNILRKTALAAAVALLLPTLAQANPANGTVVAGSVSIGGQGSQLVVTQTSNSAIVNWGSFSVGSNESVRFEQPSASAAILNRVTGGTASNIAGSLDANGRVFLVNPNGIVIGSSANINVGSLIATTLDIADADFNAGKYAFKQGSTTPAGISNAGNIIAVDGGNVVLMADHVANTGYIKASYGTVALHAGSALTLSFDDDGLINYAIDDIEAGNGGATSSTAGVSNDGSLYADGGTVFMTAAVARSAIKTVVNNSGVISAKTMEDGSAGAIILAGGGGDVEISGQIEGSYVGLVASRDVFKTSGQQLNVDADGLSVTAGRNINLASDGTEGSNAQLNVGDGYALGVDTAMVTQLQQKYPSLAPSSLAPNAGFDAGGTVAIGDLYVGGGYLYVRATSASVQSIATEGNLFYNYRPTRDDASTSVPTSFELPISASSVTLAFGGTDYDGNINVGSASQAIGKSFSGANSSFVFMTNGTVSGAGNVRTSGTVAVLAGASTGGNPGQPGEPVPPEAQAVAHEIATVTSNTQDTLRLIDLALATPPSAETSLIRQESSVTQQCQ